MCDIVCDAAAKLDCRSKALERVDGQYEYKYMYNKRAVEEVMEEAESEAELAEVEVEDESPEVEAEAELPSDYTWAMNLDMHADKADMFKAAGILQFTSTLKNACIVQQLSRLYNQIETLIRWATIECGCEHTYTISTKYTNEPQLHFS